MANRDWLNTAARRAVEHPWTLGAVLEAYKDLEDIDDEELIRRLGCDQEHRQLLAVCRQPREQHFAEDVVRIAGRFSLDAGCLAAILRRVEVVDALRSSSSRQESGTDATLLAARDRKHEDDEP